MSAPDGDGPLDALWDDGPDDGPGLVRAGACAAGALALLAAAGLLAWLLAWLAMGALGGAR